MILKEEKEKNIFLCNIFSNFEAFVTLHESMCTVRNSLVLVNYVTISDDCDICIIIDIIFRFELHSARKCFIKNLLFNYPHVCT